MDTRFRRSVQTMGIITFLILMLSLSAFTYPGTKTTNPANIVHKQVATAHSPFILSAGNISPIHNAAYGQCLDADLNTMANNGTKVQLWQCNNSAQQMWKLTVYSNGTMKIQSQHSPFRCLDADLNTIANNGTKVQLWDCNNSTQQQWNLFSLPNGNTSIASNHPPYHYLDADLNTINRNGTKVQLWGPVGGTNQQWY